MQNKSLIMKDYKLKHIVTDFDKMKHGENTIELSTEAGIMLPKKDANLTAIVKIIVTFKRSDSDSIILKVINEGLFEFVRQFTPEETDKLLRSEAVQIIYEKTRELVGKILEISNIEFMNIPPYADVTGD